MGPTTTALCGSQRMMEAPIETSLSVKYMRDSNIFSCTNMLPVHWVAATIAIDVRSAGNAGHGPSSSFGTCPNASSRITSSLDPYTCRSEPSTLHSIPRRRKPIIVESRCSIGARSIVISLRVTAASPMKDPVSTWSEPIEKSAPRSSSTPSISRICVPMPSIRAPILFSNRHKS